jgi:hypothetical protein
MLRLLMVRRPTILGEKVGTFFGGRGGWHFGSDAPGHDKGRIPGGELHGVTSHPLCFFLKMMALKTSCILCYLLFACFSMFVSCFSASCNICWQRTY